MKRNQEINENMSKKIKNFWQWFADNSEAIKRAILYQENVEEVIFHLDRNLGYISKRIGYLIKNSKGSSGNLKIIFTAHGNRKLIPKVIALSDNFPGWNGWNVEIFIQPSKNIEELKQRLDVGQTD